MAPRSKSTRRGAFETDHDEQRSSAATDVNSESMTAQHLRDDDGAHSSVITQEHVCIQSAPSAALCDKLERTRRLQNLRQQRYRARKKRSLSALEQQSQHLRAENARLEQAVRAMLSTEPCTHR